MPCALRDCSPHLGCLAISLRRDPRRGHQGQGTSERTGSRKPGGSTLRLHPPEADWSALRSDGHCAPVCGGRSRVSASQTEIPGDRRCASGASFNAANSPVDTKTPIFPQFHRDGWPTGNASFIDARRVDARNGLHYFFVDSIGSHGNFYADVQILTLASDKLTSTSLKGEGRDFGGNFPLYSVSSDRKETFPCSAVHWRQQQIAEIHSRGKIAPQ